MVVTFQVKSIAIDISDINLVFTCYGIDAKIPSAAQPYF